MKLGYRLQEILKFISPPPPPPNNKNTEQVGLSSNAYD
jgi:hypothetical protein